MDLRTMEGFESSRVLKKAPPIYPDPAITGRVQGTVRLKATIAKDGTVQNIEVMSGPALLVQAAEDAVRRWTFLPARYRGEIVEDVTHVTVNFALAQ